MRNLSVVIICRNEAAIIAKTLESLRGLTDDIVVYDSGSTDGTQGLVKSAGARLVEGTWAGYGPTKKVATGFAVHDWILSLDADEAISPRLKEEIRALNPARESDVFELRFLNFLGKQPLRFGEWGGDRHVRLFNKNLVTWDEAPVHEKLLVPPESKVITLKGYVHHFTARNLEQYREKLRNYAQLNAQKYQREGRKVSWFRKTFSAPFSFVNNYIFRLGFLDGRAGFQCAIMNAQYTYLKYEKLKEQDRG